MTFSRFYSFSFASSSAFLRSVGLLGASVFFLGGCAATDKIDLHEDEVPAQTYYNNAMLEASSGQRKEAIEGFDKLSRVYPYSIWAARGQLIAAYLYYRKEDYKNALVEIERYLTIHPSGKDAPYAFYLKALLLLEDIKAIGLEQETTQQALDAFKEVIQRFPQSVYAESARHRLALLRNQLAAKELFIARAEEKKGEFATAISRLLDMLKEYDDTSQSPEALYRLSANYLNIGLSDESIQAAATLAKNFPHSRWYAKVSQALKKNHLWSDAQKRFHFPDPPKE